MAKILPFRARDEDKPEPPPVNMREDLRARTRETIRTLVEYYRSTGKWDDAACEGHVVLALNRLTEVCDYLARGESNEQPPSIR